jgi:hypothetical protein
MYMPYDRRPLARFSFDSLGRIWGKFSKLYATGAINGGAQLGGAAQRCIGLAYELSVLKGDFQCGEL